MSNRFPFPFAQLSKFIMALQHVKLNKAYCNIGISWTSGPPRIDRIDSTVFHHTGLYISMDGCLIADDERLGRRKPRICNSDMLNVTY